jgi:NADH:ubiquinone oxidoreductase subunit 6 (subunit J)
MLTRVGELKDRLDGDQRPLAAVAALTLLGAFAAVMNQTEWPRDVGQLTVVPFSTIGDALFGRWAVPFEIASGVLLVALVGAIVVAMQEEGET